jgi:hypothetical protein
MRQQSSSESEKLKRTAISCPRLTKIVMVIFRPLDVMPTVDRKTNEAIQKALYADHLDRQ